MKLIGQQHSKYKDKEYFKYWIVIPNGIITKLGWKRGQELKPDIKNDKLIVDKV